MRAAGHELFTVAAGRDAVRAVAENELASQLEELLYISHTLKLEKVAKVLHAFTHQQLSVGPNGLFEGTAAHIVSGRVVRALGIQFKPAEEVWVKWITCNDNAVSPCP
jgi:hypothetical protein